MRRGLFLAGSASAAALVLPTPLRAHGLPNATSAETPEPVESPHEHGPNGLVTLPIEKRLEWTMDVLDGPEFRLSKYAGKTVFVNCFATWCPPCNEEQPMLVDFAAAYAADTAVIGVDIAEEDDVVRKYRAKYKITYPIAMDRNNVFMKRAYVGQRIEWPLTIVIAPNRMLSCAWVGGRDRDWFENEREAAFTYAGLKPGPAAASS